MRTIKLTALLAAALAASPISADELDDAQSLESRYWNGDFERNGDFRYGSSGRSYYFGNDGQPYIGPRGRRGYVQSTSGAPPAEELLQMDYRQLRNVARDSSANFDRWLSGIPAGEVWRKHFESRSIQELLASDVDAPPAADEREAIVRILGIFDRAVAASELDDLTRMGSARTLHAALRELATPPDRRLVRQLSLSARIMNRSLDAIKTGVTWQRYLALPDGIIAAVDRPPGDAEPRPEFDSEELGQILERYDNVSTNEEYRAIASLPEFQATHERLIELVNPPPKTPPPVPTPSVAEELPPGELETR